MKAIDASSGDQDGMRSFAGSSVRRRVSLPSARMSTMSSCDERLVQASHDASFDGAHQPSDGLCTDDFGVTRSGFAGSKL